MPATAFSSRKKADPVLHAAVERTIYVQAGGGGVEGHLAGYSRLAGKGAYNANVRISERGGWKAVRLRDPGYTTWVFHNLAFWMLDCPGGE